MDKGRMEAFSDGVIAIIITIMVLEIRIPHGESLAELKPLLPVVISYLLSFIHIAIYWNNHHHMLRAAEHVNGKVLWANMHLLFWLSLIPFATGWMGENNFAQGPVLLYGTILFMGSIAYYILSRTLISLHGQTSVLAKAVGRDLKGIISTVIYIAAITVVFFNPLVSLCLYAIVALWWIIPDRRIEKKVTHEDTPSTK